MRFLLFVIALTFLLPTASAVHYGQSRDEVIKELGKPNSDLKRGNREVLLYKAGRIELEDGKVAVVQGLPVTAGEDPAPVAPTPEPAVAKPVQPPVAAPAQAETQSKAASAKPQKSVEQEMLDADAAARAKMEKDIEALSNPAPVQVAHDAGPARWMSFGVELLIKGLMMLAALKLTTKYWGVEISWSGLVIAAAADTVTRAVVGGVVLWALGLGSTMYADEAAAALVLMVVLRKVSYNQSLTQAVRITITSKTFSIVVGSFLSVVVTRLIFGGGGGSLMPF